MPCSWAMSTTTAAQGPVLLDTGGATRHQEAPGRTKPRQQTMCCEGKQHRGRQQRTMGRGRQQRTMCCISVGPQQPLECMQASTRRCALSEVKCAVLLRAECCTVGQRSDGGWGPHSSRT